MITDLINDPNILSLQLDVSDNIKDRDIKLLSELLAANEIITSLNLSDVNISNIGCKYLSDMLMTNTALTELILNRCYITDIGITNLVEGLYHNETLVHLNVQHNNFNIGTTLFNNLLKVNNTLKEIIGIDAQNL